MRGGGALRPDSSGRFCSIFSISRESFVVRNMRVQTFKIQATPMHAS
jgi:hypothetical protein